MKTLAFQTFLCNPEAKPRGNQLIKKRKVGRLYEAEYTFKLKELILKRKH